MTKIKQFLFQYKHAALAIFYGIFYVLWFAWLEQEVTTNFQVIHMGIDDHIPFLEIFIIPYLLWFAYIAVVIIYLIFQDKSGYYKACIFLGTGMTIFLIISTLWPNGHLLRPTIMPRDNIFTQLIENLYNTDTATNLWPSIHVYNSIGAHLAVVHSKKMENKRGIRIASLILSTSIILSTMFIKQHSVFDVLTAFALATIMYLLVYRMDFVAAYKKKTQPQVS